MSVIPVDFRALYPNGSSHAHAEPLPALSPTVLGASLYVPASRPDLATVALS